MRAFLFILFTFFAAAAAPKGGKTTNNAKGPAAKAPTSPPTNPPSSAPPTPETILVDLKAIANNMLKLYEQEKFEESAALFATGMAYVTNGRQYELDLSIPADIKSIPMRYRSEVAWTYSDLDDYELWGHTIVRYAADNSTEPEFILLHFNKNGLIDLFSHIQPKAAQCTAIVQDVQPKGPTQTQTQQVTKLALMRTDGTIVDAPQEQLQAMLAQQNAAKAAAEAARNNATSTDSNTTATITTNTTTTINTTTTASNFTKTGNATRTQTRATTTVTESNSTAPSTITKP